MKSSSNLARVFLSYTSIKSYFFSDEASCDAITGSSKVILLFPTSCLMNLSEPFLRPYPDGNCITSL